MNVRTALRKSLLIAPAEIELRRATTSAELHTMWLDFGGGFVIGSPEREQLRKVYLEQRGIVEKREAESEALRLARAL